MARPRPYLFCRYHLAVDDEPLGVKAQLTALQELQGQLFAHGPTAEHEGRFDTVIMRPRMLTVGRERVLTWSVGQKIDARLGVRYDQKRDSLEFVHIDDGTVRYKVRLRFPRRGTQGHSNPPRSPRPKAGSAASSFAAALPARTHFPSPASPPRMGSGCLPASAPC